MRGERHVRRGATPSCTLSYRHPPSAKAPFPQTNRIHSQAAFPYSTGTFVPLPRLNITIKILYKYTVMTRRPYSIEIGQGGAFSMERVVYGSSDSACDNSAVVAIAASNVAGQRACRGGFACGPEWPHRAGSRIARTRLARRWCDGTAGRALGRGRNALAGLRAWSSHEAGGAACDACGTSFSAERGGIEGVGHRCRARAMGALERRQGSLGRHSGIEAGRHRRGSGVVVECARR